MTVSTHVLDTERGRPAAGVRVELYAADGSLVADGLTDEDGRIRDLADTEPVFKRVELTIQLGDGHHHVPLLISSYACASYRGS